MRVEDVMTTQIATCRPETNLAEAIASMWEKNCGVLPVIGENDEVLGMITDRDISVALGTRNVRASDLVVGDVAHNHVLKCNASDDLHVALEAMSNGKVRRLPVIGSQGGIAGVVSIDDIVMSAGPDPMGSGISHAEVVSALQEICCSNEQLCQRLSAA
jgi:CBS domain-containing protein